MYRAGECREARAKAINTMLVLLFEIPSQSRRPVLLHRRLISPTVQHNRHLRGTWMSRRTIVADERWLDDVIGGRLMAFLARRVSSDRHRLALNFIVRWNFEELMASLIASSKHSVRLRHCEAERQAAIPKRHDAKPSSSVGATMSTRQTTLACSANACYRC